MSIAYRIAAVVVASADNDGIEMQNVGVDLAHNSADTDRTVAAAAAAADIAVVVVAAVAAASEADSGHHSRLDRHRTTLEEKRISLEDAQYFDLGRHSASVDRTAVVAAAVVASADTEAAVEAQNSVAEIGHNSAADTESTVAAVDMAVVVAAGFDESETEADSQYRSQLVQRRTKLVEEHKTLAVADSGNSFRQTASNFSNIISSNSRNPNLQVVVDKNGNYSSSRS